ncbi:hypothetical protein GHT06_010241 [Daphnia sinensis]|uniref:BTB domain-containing protein n=1 Tax=Daphnia sinensis TaxID=1820382 RepID=A0AAD5PWS6_9CRUS|nr:hypothetical protein GHT06_010241 [Daphnia sinensis]
MSFSAKVSKQDETLVKVNWYRKFTPDIQKSGPHQVSRTHGYSYTYYFELQCNLLPTPKINTNQTQTKNFRFCLTTRPGENDGSNPTDDEDAIPDYYRLPCDIWLTVGNVATKHFFVKCPESKWKSRRIPIPSHYGDYDDHYGDFGGVLWIKFKSTGISELNAVRRMTELLVKQRRCDVQFIFECGHLVGGHVTILSASSPVFEAMFTNDMVEAKTGQVAITDIEKEIFKEPMHYIYAGHTSTPLTELTARSLYEAAEKYDIQDLREECVDFLLFHIQLNNAIHLLIWANAHSIDEIKEAALKFVAENFRTLCPTAEWENLVKNYPELCLLATRMMK